MNLKSFAEKLGFLEDVEVLVSQLQLSHPNSKELKMAQAMLRMLVIWEQHENGKS